MRRVGGVGGGGRDWSTCSYKLVAGIAEKLSGLQLLIINNFQHFKYVVGTQICATLRQMLVKKIQFSIGYRLENALYTILKYPGDTKKIIQTDRNIYMCLTYY